MGNATTMMKMRAEPLGWTHKSAYQGYYSLEAEPCVCANAISVFETMKSETPNPLTRSASLEMLKHHTHNPVDE